MEFPSNSVPDPAELTSLVEPYLYLRQADVALLQGNREQAIALIGRIYLAFDLLVAGCDEISDSDRIRRKEVTDRHAQHLAQPDHLLGRHTDQTFFVILELLDANSKGFGNGSFGESQGQTLTTYAPGDVPVDWHQSSAVPLECHLTVNQTLM